jgi:hypothetical protein
VVLAATGYGLLLWPLNLYLIAPFVGCPRGAVGCRALKDVLVPHHPFEPRPGFRSA